MKLKHKFSLLVAACTLLLLGLNYGFSVYSAKNAIVEFNQRSAVILATSLLSTSVVEEFIEELPEESDIKEITDALLSQFNDQFFIVLSRDALIADSTDEERL